MERIFVIFCADLGPPSGNDHWKVQLHVQLLAGMQLGLSIRQVWKEPAAGSRYWLRKDVILSWNVVYSRHKDWILLHKLIAPLACIAKAATTIELPSLAGAPGRDSIAKDLSHIEFTIEVITNHNCFVTWANPISGLGSSEALLVSWLILNQSLSCQLQSEELGDACCRSQGSHRFECADVTLALCRGGAVTSPSAYAIYIKNILYWFVYINFSLFPCLDDKGPISSTSLQGAWSLVETTSGPRHWILLYLSFREKEHVKISQNKSKWILVPHSVAHSWGCYVVHLQTFNSAENDRASTAQVRWFWVGLCHRLTISRLSFKWISESLVYFQKPH